MPPEPLLELLPRVGEIPFTSESKRMATLHETPEGITAFAKGAPEVILPSCALDDPGREAVLAEAQRMAASALRVLAVARKRPADPEDAEDGLTFVGLADMIDPPRPEAKDATVMPVLELAKWMARRGWFGRVD